MKQCRLGRNEWKMVKDGVRLASGIAPISRRFVSRVNLTKHPVTRNCKRDMGARGVPLLDDSPL